MFENMCYTFSKNSLDKLELCHHDLQLIMRESIKNSQIDFGISEGYRSIERQKLLYDAGKSKLDGGNNKSKHNEMPSMAIDIYAFVKGKVSFAEKDLSYLGGVITSIASTLFNKGEVSCKLRWGGNWDRDGEILTDQSFIDMPHFELI